MAISFSQCIDGKQLAFLGVRELNFSNAEASCATFNEGFIARIDSTDANNIVRAFVGAQDDLFKIWVGIEDDKDIGGKNNTARFNFVDGGADSKDFFLRNGTSPWGPGEPNDNNDGENCVQFKINLNQWNDVPCANRASIVCQLSCSLAGTPTISPTISPQSSDNLDRFNSEVLAASLSALFVFFTIAVFSLMRERYALKKLELKFNSLNNTSLAEPVIPMIDEKSPESLL